MPEERDLSSVLVVSGTDKGNKYISDLLPPADFSPVAFAGSAGEAKRMMLLTPYDIVIINCPLPDEFGAGLALDISKDEAVGVLLMVKNELYEQITYKVEEHGVFTVGKPGTKQSIYQAVKLLVAAKARLRRVEMKAAGLQAKMEEIRIVNRAKWLLIDHFKMNESEAHRYIEKQSMDTRTPRREVAEGIIRTYEI